MVSDTARHSSIIVNKIQASNTRQAWLSEKKIPYDPNQVRVCREYIQYGLEVIARSSGHRVSSVTMTYHCQCNSIQRAQVKPKIADKNNTFRLLRF